MRSDRSFDQTPAEKQIFGGGLQIFVFLQAGAGMPCRRAAAVARRGDTQTALPIRKMYGFAYTLKQLPPMNSRIRELQGIMDSSAMGRKYFR